MLERMNSWEQIPPGVLLNRTESLNFIRIFHEMIKSHFTCPICQFPVRHPTILRCSHVFCEPCLQSWARTQDRKGEFKSCPMCRSLITMDLIKEETESESEESSNEAVFRSPIHLFLDRIYCINRFFKFQAQLKHEEKITYFLQTVNLTKDFDTIVTISELNFCNKSNSSLLNASRKLRRILENQDFQNIQKNLSKLKENGTVSQIFLKRLQQLWSKVVPSDVRRSFRYLYTHIIFQAWPFKLLPCLHRRFRSARWINGRFSPTHFSIRKPPPLLYFWLVFTAAYTVLVILLGPGTLRQLGVKAQVKRLLQHAVFLYVDTPAYEMIAIVYEAFTTPL